MNGFLNRLKSKLQVWMQGRYGTDKLTVFLNSAALLLILLSSFIPLRFLYILSLAALVWSCIRCYSRNIAARRKELDAYMHLSSPIRNRIALWCRKFKDRKAYRYFSCKQCKTLIRVPVGRGKIKIVCPKCGTTAVKKT